MLDIELSCPGTHVEFIDGSVVGVIRCMRKVLLVEGPESCFGVGVEGLEPGGELTAGGRGGDVDCGHSEAQNNEK